MNALELYKSALEKMAAAGQADAQLILAMGAELDQSCPSAPKWLAEVMRHLNNADGYLGYALADNDRNWNRSTDKNIESARASMNQAKSVLALR